MPADREKIWAVVPAAGAGRRMGAAVPKQYLELNGRAVLAHTLERLAQNRRVEKIIVAIAADDERYSELAPQLSQKCAAVTGGAERCHSVLAGLQQLNTYADDNDWVLVHDAARPCLRTDDLERMFDELGGNEVGGILAVPVRDTLKRSDANQIVDETVDRARLWHALTPQMFRFGLLQRALEDALNRGQMVTDEAQAVENAGYRPHLVQGHADNLKITHAEDLKLATLIQAAQGASN